MTSLKGFILLCGADGTGKSSVVKKLNEDKSEYIAIERSGDGQPPEWRKMAMAVDRSTLKYTFEKYEEPTWTLEYEHKTYPIYWIMLDGPLQVLESRLKSRPVHDEWETSKTLNYFRERLREIATYHGIPLLDTSKFDIDGVAREVRRIIDSGEYDEIRQIRTQSLTYEQIHERDIELVLAGSFSEEVVASFDPHLLEHKDGFMDEELFKACAENKGFKRRLMSRWLISGTMTISGDQITLQRDLLQLTIPKRLYFKQYTEGESKKVYQVVTNNPYLTKIVIIILKSTIYSHSKQATGEIEGLGAIRAKGTRMFLEMMWRNKLAHCYRSLNDYGIIIADFVDTQPIEIVFKKYCEGTDKHSFYDMRALRSVVLETGEYVSGPYVRFDWRNPNHVSLKTGTNVIINPYYYLMEEHYGKESFFESFLKDGKRARPFGDRAVYADILEGLINVPQCRYNAIKIFCTIDQYFREVGLEVKDGCVMLDKKGEVFWSEINQDCMRIQSTSNSESLDKDIWRAGGSASKDQVVQKWVAFNKIMEQYFLVHRYQDTEMKDYSHLQCQQSVHRILADRRLNIPHVYNGIYQKLLYQEEVRSVILTVDIYDQKPVLVQKGRVCEVHSDGDIAKALAKISLFSDILLVDLNGAFGEQKNNRETIKAIAKSHYIYTGGGVRTLEDAEDLLKSSVRRVVVSSNTDEAFLKAIPKNRLIVELSVDEHDNVLIHGRKTNTNVNLIDKVLELVKLGVRRISITCHNTEGLLTGLPRAQIRSIVERIPDSVERVIIAGGISSMDDIEFLWSLPRVTPQLGSAIWKDKISIGDLYVGMTRFDEKHQVPTIIQDRHGMVKGLVYMNAEALHKTCETRQLYRFSRRENRVMCKGETSGNYQKVIMITPDCDSDSLLVTVEVEHPFCHTGQVSCFNIQSSIKANILTTMEHIKSRRELPTYSGHMQRHPGLALSKIMEEYWEVVCATKNRQVAECSDLLVHFLMYLSGINANFEDILNELHARRWDPHLLSSGTGKSKKVANAVVVGITSEKFFTKPDIFCRDVLGFEVLRPKGRVLKIDYRVTDPAKFKQYFGDRSLILVPLRPRDMNMMVALGTVDCVVSYDPVMHNKPLVYKTVVELPEPGIRIALIKRKGVSIDTSTWTPSNKAVIATEHVKYTHDFLVGKKGLSEDVFTLVHIAGASESFIVNDSKTNYVLCDAVVETGTTLIENNLEIWEVTRDYGDIKIGLYISLTWDD